MKIFELSFQKNIRDLGGLVGFDNRPIKYGRLYRGGFLNKLSEEDKRIIESFHLTDIVDFRSSDEYISRADYRFDNVSYHNFSTFEHQMKKEDKKYEDGNLLWFIDEGNDGFSHLSKTYRELIDTEDGKNAYRKFFELLLSDNQRVIYFHCSQGKDRAGVAAMLIELGLGVSFEDIKKDYLLSNIAMEKRVDNLINSVKDKPYYNGRYHQSLLDVFSAKLEYLKEAIDIINDKYGGPISYLENELNVDVNKLRDYYLEK